MMSLKRYLLRELSTEDELEVLLRLRYKVFTIAHADKIVARNSQEIDMNYYDRNSRHYAIYREDVFGLRPAGYFRVILKQKTKADQWVSNIGLRLGIFSTASQQPSASFPSFSEYADDDLRRQFCLSEVEGKRIGEVSRFMIVQSERSIKLALFIVKSAFAIASLHVHEAFVCCRNDHARLYKSLGFRNYYSGNNPGIALQQDEPTILVCNEAFLTPELKRMTQITGQQFLSDNCLRFEN